MRKAAMLALAAATIIVAAARSASQQPRSAGADTAAAATAVLTERAPDLDGRDDDPVWQRAPRYAQFRQFEPKVDVDPSFRTEFRAAYDERNLYVFVRMFDPHPDSIMHALSRRDVRGPSDQIKLLIDSYNDRRSGFEFAVNPDGVKRDYSMSNDGNEDESWNGVWEVATRVDSLGWTAEFRIPLSQLRFSAPAAAGTPELVWGVNFIRWISRKGEDSQWSLIPTTASAWVPYYGELRGLRLLAPPRRLEAQPYSLARVTHSPREDGNPLVRRVDAGASLGADLRYGLTPNITLTAAVNPDFGQVEADPSEVNLTAFETFHQERRAFFKEGTDIFRVRLGEWFEERELFYSRRIGRPPEGTLPDSAQFTDVPAATSILGAAKLSGKTAGGWSLGALDAVAAALGPVPFERAALDEPLSTTEFPDLIASAAASTVTFGRAS
jgi:hypothetical protein